ncbi:SGNH/GDSL hydrolase family protein [Conexibacter woesei]|uniref:Lipolytic protein G-D-S-L family n=1 Tax=Conexibacter woesei (strain DSM 14684 / CCUG 47730 / CIP 108061 / JCM 11494 / NBRC 100937 / ID131577) TaxID=469383 RepID=D3F514_CONWI|nr:SGNH/GDSL hydrolase family protein [Conexibacter woesei]ADB48592.1 lipolytic protein G-D-S-L family [Conexibacter woesei DSM 14684]
MTTYPNELADPDVLGGHEEHALLRGAPWRRFAVLGDSVAAGVGERVDGYLALTWAERVARGLRSHHPGLAYLNLGVRDLRAQQVRETQLAPALTFAPDLAAVIAGGNDLLSRRFDPDAVARELEAIVAPLRDVGAEVFMFRLLDITLAIDVPEPYGTRLSERLAALNDATSAVAERQQALVVAGAAHTRAADPPMYSSDLMHLNLRGQAVIGSEAIRELSRVLAPPVEGEPLGLRPRVPSEELAQGLVLPAVESGG